MDYSEDNAKKDKHHHYEEEVKESVNELLITETDTEIPDNKYFKGFWAFALWEYIPPPECEEYKCTLITWVVDEGKKKLKKIEGLNQRLQN